MKSEFRLLGTRKKETLRERGQMSVVKYFYRTEFRTTGGGAAF